MLHVGSCRQGVYFKIIPKTITEILSNITHSHIIPEPVLFVSTPSATKQSGTLLGWSAPVLATTKPPTMGTSTELRGEMRGIKMTTEEGPAYMLSPFSVFIKKSGYLDSKGVVSAKCEIFDRFSSAVEDEVFNLEEVTTPSPRDPCSTFISISHHERLQRQQLNSLEIHAGRLLRKKLLFTMLLIKAAKVTSRCTRIRERITLREDLLFSEIMKRMQIEESQILSYESIHSAIAPAISDCRERIKARSTRLKRRESKIAALKNIIKLETDARAAELAADAEEQESQRRKWEAEDFLIPKSDFEIECRNEWDDWFQQRSQKHLEKKTSQITAASEALLNSFG